MSDKIREAFDYLFDTHLKNICVPTDGNKKKAEGCFNAVNDYGKEPTEKACRKCWETALYGDMQFQIDELVNQIKELKCLIREAAESDEVYDILYRYLGDHP